MIRDCQTGSTDFKSGAVYTIPVYALQTNQRPAQAAVAATDCQLVCYHHLRGWRRPSFLLTAQPNANYHRGR
jgi:hypothetical protein